MKFRAFLTTLPKINVSLYIEVLNCFLLTLSCLSFPFFLSFSFSFLCVFFPKKQQLQTNSRRQKKKKDIYSRSSLISLNKSERERERLKEDGTRAVSVTSSRILLVISALPSSMQIFWFSFQRQGHWLMAVGKVLLHLYLSIVNPFHLCNRIITSWSKNLLVVLTWWDKWPLSEGRTIPLMRNSFIISTHW